MGHRTLHSGFLPGPALILALVLVAVSAPPAAHAAIYKCTDARGRTITADRPIVDCADREQSELNSSGTLLRKVEPTYTVQEQAERDARAREAARLASLQTDERRRVRALLTRYPNAATHDRERREALVQIESIIQGARKRLDELAAERVKIDGELEFYRKDPSKVPGTLHRRADDNTQNAVLQNRFIADQEVEKKRVNARFDEERTQLTPLWAAPAR